MSESIVYVDTSTIACDDHNPASSHPRVYLNLEKTGRTICPYCSCLYILKG